jgi:hypothetical protein
VARIKYWDEASQSWKYADKSLKIDNSFLIDETLTIAGRAADAKIVGEAIEDAKTYAVEKAAEAAEDAKTYATEKAAEAAEDAKTYATEKAAEAAQAMKEDILNGADVAYDTLKEVGALIEENKEAIEALEVIAGK